METDLFRWLERDLGEATERLFSLLRFDELYRVYAHPSGRDRVHIRLTSSIRSDSKSWPLSSQPLSPSIRISPVNSSPAKRATSPGRTSQASRLSSSVSSGTALCRLKTMAPMHLKRPIRRALVCSAPTAVCRTRNAASSVSALAPATEPCCANSASTARGWATSEISKPSSSVTGVEVGQLRRLRAAAWRRALILGWCGAHRNQTRLVMWRRGWRARAWPWHGTAT
jgi:hypothetical protein